MKGWVVVLTLNRPAKRNAITLRMAQPPCGQLRHRPGASTHAVAGDAAARAAGTLTWLQPGESRTYRTMFRVEEP